MIKKNLQQLAHMTSGRFIRKKDADILFEGVSIDSRTIEPNNLFIPIVGERFDGHQFIEEAMQCGAAAVLWQHDHGEPPEHIPVVIVEDTLRALQQMAATYRQELSVRVVGVTGSNGKTTTKDMIAAVLGKAFKVHKTQGNFNNEYGLPLTLLRMDEDTEFAILEMGMSGKGEIASLSAIAKPDAAVITNIGEAHLQQLGSREAIAEAKLEILQGLCHDGIFIYHGDDTLLQQEVEKQLAHGQANPTIIRFGMKANNDYAPIAVMMDEYGTSFMFNQPSDLILRIPVWGRHNVINAAAAVAAGRAFGLSWELIRQGLESVKLTSMRMEITRTPSGVTVINDAYNASPSSMRAAIELLEELSGYKRKIAVLGDMLELGDKAIAYHTAIGDALDPKQIHMVMTCGKLAVNIGQAAGSKYPTGHVRMFQDKAPLIKELQNMVASGDVILIKGSRGMQLEEVVEALIMSHS